MVSLVSLGGVCHQLLCSNKCKTRPIKKKNRGTVLAADLVGDSKCPSLIAVSFNDTKTVHFLSMEADSIKLEDE